MGNNKGMTLVEIIVACALVIGLLLGVTSTVSNLFQLNAIMDKKTDSFSDLSLMRLNLSKKTVRLFYNPIFLNQTILSALSLSDLAFDYPDKGGYFSIIPFREKYLSGVKDNGLIQDLKVVKAGPQTDLFLMLGQNRDGSLTVLPPADGTKVYDFTDPSTAGGTLEVKETRSGSGSAFESGDLVALSTDQGTQIVRVSSYGGGQLEFLTMGPCSTGFGTSNMPLGLVNSGALIEKINVYLLGVDSETKYLYFLNLGDNGNYNVIAKITRPIQSMKINNMSDNEVYTWDLPPLSNIGYLVVIMEPVTIGNQLSRAERLNFPF